MSRLKISARNGHQHQELELRRARGVCDATPSAWSRLGERPSLRSSGRQHLGATKSQRLAGPDSKALGQTLRRPPAQRLDTKQLVPRNANDKIRSPWENRQSWMASVHLLTKTPRKCSNRNELPRSSPQQEETVPDVLGPVGDGCNPGLTPQLNPYRRVQSRRENKQARRSQTRSYTASVESGPDEACYVICSAKIWTISRSTPPLPTSPGQETVAMSGKRKQY